MKLDNINKMFNLFKHITTKQLMNQNNKKIN